MHDPLTLAFSIKRPMPIRTVGGRRYWPSVIDVWHREPKGRDSLSVCGRTKDGKRKPGRSWRWHVHHWHVRVIPVLHFKRWAFSRCVECGRRFPWGYSPVSYSWGGLGPGWFRNRERSYHSECSGLIERRRQCEQSDLLIRFLFDALCQAGETSPQDTLDRLTHVQQRGGLPFLAADKLQRVVGFKRDDAYNLVPTGAADQ